MVSKQCGNLNCRKVYDCIKANPKGIRMADIAEELELDIHEVRSHVMRLHANGEIEHIGRVKSSCTKIWGVRR